MANTHIAVDELDIDFHGWHDWLLADHTDGAVVTFLGKVRSESPTLQNLTLEHYPTMTFNALESIIAKARTRWTLNRIVLIHRIGKIEQNENIVFVGVSSAHRIDAFDSAQFIMDYLKNNAPFWKKECFTDHEQWVESKKSDLEALKKWH